MLCKLAKADFSILLTETVDKIVILLIILMMVVRYTRKSSQ